MLTNSVVVYIILFKKQRETSDSLRNQKTTAMVVYLAWRGIVDKLRGKMIDFEHY
jgi:hypothetical protein